MVYSLYIQYYILGIARGGSDILRLRAREERQDAGGGIRGRRAQLLMNNFSAFQMAIETLHFWKISSILSWTLFLYFYIYSYHDNIFVKRVLIDCTSLKSSIADVLPPSSVEINLLPVGKHDLCNKKLDICSSSTVDADEQGYLHEDLLVDLNWRSNRKRTKDTTLRVYDIVQGYQVLFEGTFAYTYTNFLGVPMQQDPRLFVTIINSTCWNKINNIFSFLQ